MGAGLTGVGLMGGAGLTGAGWRGKGARGEQQSTRDTVIDVVSFSANYARSTHTYRSSY